MPRPWAAWRPPCPRRKIPMATSAPVLSPITLGLIQGSWNAWAANNIIFLRCRIPTALTMEIHERACRGIRRQRGQFGGSNQPAVSVQLCSRCGGASLGRQRHHAGQPGPALERQSGNNAMPSIYAPVLSLDAGAGGSRLTVPFFFIPQARDRCRSPRATAAIWWARWPAAAARSPPSRCPAAVCWTGIQLSAAGRPSRRCTRTIPIR